MMLRNILLYFLAALCRVSVCDKEVLSPTQEKIIKEKYEETFGIAMDQKLFKELIKYVKKNPGDYKKMEKLSQEIVVTDAMAEIIFNGMVEIATTNDVIGPKERKVISRISDVTLGMNKEVVDLELNRHKQRIGNRFDSDNADTCYRRSSLLSSHSISQHTRSSLLNRSPLKKR